MSFLFRNRKKLEAQAWVSKAEQNIKFHSTMLHQKDLNLARNYNSLRNNFREKYNLDESFEISEIVLEKHLIVMDCRKLLRKLHVEEKIYKQVEYIAEKIDKFEKECNLIEEFLYDVVIYSNIKPKTTENGLVVNYNELCMIWDEFFSKWKIPCNMYTAKYFEPGKYFCLQDKVFCSKEELKLLYINYLKVANDCKYQAKKDFIITTSACIFCKFMSSIPKVIGNSAKYFPEN